jgi:hypothetical protein
VRERKVNWLRAAHLIAAGMAALWLAVFVVVWCCVYALTGEVEDISRVAAGAVVLSAMFSIHVVLAARDACEEESAS